MYICVHDIHSMHSYRFQIGETVLQEKKLIQAYHVTLHVPHYKHTRHASCKHPILIHVPHKSTYQIPMQTHVPMHIVYSTVQQYTHTHSYQFQIGETILQKHNLMWKYVLLYINQMRTYKQYESWAGLGIKEQQSRYTRKQLNCCVTRKIVYA